MSASKKILLTGGAGYIGSHTYVALVEAGYQVTIFDNFCNARTDVIDRLEKITENPVDCVHGDVRNRDDLEAAFVKTKFDAVIHFAALKAVGDSVERPLEYIETNVGGLTNLLKIMRDHKVFNLVFSSSATVYGDPDVLPIPESAPLDFANPYGFTKLVGEQILGQIQHADKSWTVGILRYFNPVGAHASALIGEDPMGVPSNLMPYIAKVATGELPNVQVFGDDYATPDGTGVRDYIHVCDLAEGHVASLAQLFSHNCSHTLNLGSGVGYSVLEMISGYSKAAGKELPFEIVPRRKGDIASCYADSRLAADLLGFKTKYTLQDMCDSSWAWVSRSMQR